MINKMGLYVLILIAPTVNAATFCVDSSMELQDTLNLVGNNGQDDEIKIKSGSYSSLNNGFVFNNNEDFDLTISGGWLSVISSCDSNPIGSAQSTILDGENQHRALTINEGDSSANITVSFLSFVNGMIPSNQHGGGLSISAPMNTGSISVTNSYFINNYADFEAALFINGGNRVNVKNNLFVINETESGAAVGLLQSNSTGIYFSNNTMISNIGWGLRVFVSGSSQALIANNILWGNDDFDLVFAGSGVKYSYHNDIGIQFNSADFQSGNFSEEPSFQNGSFLEFIPTLSSPLHDGGYHPFPFPFPPAFDRNWSLGVSDILGRNREQDNQVDIGAFEAAAEVAIFANGFE